MIDHLLSWPYSRYIKLYIFFLRVLSCYIRSSGSIISIYLDFAHNTSIIRQQWPGCLALPGCCLEYGKLKSLFPSLPLACRVLQSIQAKNISYLCELNLVHQNKEIKFSAIANATNYKTKFPNWIVRNL